MKISVIVPTKGRPSLATTVRSIVPQLSEEDELLVISDGYPLSEIRALVGHGDDGRVFVTVIDKTENNGGSQRDYGIETAIGDVLMFCDDDDIFTKDALKIVRENLLLDRGLPHIFRMQAGAGGGWNSAPVRWSGVLWQIKELRYGNIGTPMIVVPNMFNLPKWANYHLYSHDFGFIDEIVTRMFDGQVRWHEEVICIVRPSPDDLKREGP